MNQILNDAEVAQFDFLLLAELGYISARVNDHKRSKTLYFATLEKCDSTTDMSQFVQSLKAKCINNSLCIKLSSERRDSFENSLEKLRWVEVRSIHFADREWGDKSIKNCRTRFQMRQCEL